MKPGPDSKPVRDLGPDEPRRQRIEGLVPDAIRKTFYAGLGAVFASEEGIRRLANEFSLPKDVAKSLVSQAQATKSDLLRVVGGEVRSFLQDANLADELKRILSSLSLEVKTEIRFVPRENKETTTSEPSKEAAAKAKNSPKMGSKRRTRRAKSTPTDGVSRPTDPSDP